MLHDAAIAQLATYGLVSPYDPALVNPCSLDIRLGACGLLERPGGGHAHCDLTETYWLAPGSLMLVDTLEYFRLPEDLAAQLHLKSSRAREGYGHLLAGFIDPGYAGRLTLEVVNHLRYQPLPLTTGMRFAQLTFTRLRAHPRKAYRETGHYYGDTRVSPSKTGDLSRPSGTIP